MKPLLVGSIAFFLFISCQNNLPPHSSEIQLLEPVLLSETSNKRRETINSDASALEHKTHETLAFQEEVKEQNKEWLQKWEENQLEQKREHIAESKPNHNCNSFATSQKGNIELHPYFQNNMLLQRDTANWIYGTGTPQTVVKLVLDGQEHCSEVQPNGKWKILLPPQMFSTQETSLSIESKNKREIQHLLFGDLWFCSGQSNMEWTMIASQNASQELKNANFAHIRLFQEPHSPNETRKDSTSGQWKISTTANAKLFSAVCFFFGKEIHQKHKIPIGLIQSTYGGTPIESWIDVLAIQKKSSLKPIVDKWDKLVKNNPTKYKLHPYRAGNLFNGMIAPFLQTSIKGVLWYQGEANVPRAFQYQTLFPLLIQEWRKEWKQDFPFYFVQLAPYNYSGDTKECAELREAQLKTFQQVKNTGMVVTMDIGDLKNIHPKNKKEVGRRLSLWARNKNYGETKIETSGPLWKQFSIQGNKIVITFEHAQGMKTIDSSILTEFSIAGKDQIFSPANAILQGNQIEVSHPSILQPVAVRFAWKANALPNLINDSLLPASPFRTDGWEWMTQNNH